MSDFDNIIYDDEEEEEQEQQDVLDLIYKQSADAESLGKPKDPKIKVVTINLTLGKQSNI